MTVLFEVRGELTIEECDVKVAVTLVEVNDYVLDGSHGVQ